VNQIVATHESDPEVMYLLDPESSGLKDIEQLINVLKLEYESEGWTFSEAEGWNVSAFVEEAVRYGEDLRPEDEALLQKIG
jgi:hypothetical protein